MDHAIESSKLAVQFIEKESLTELEKEMVYHAILDHSKGNEISSFIGLALVLADKLDVTYHRTENSSIQDKVNIEIQKIRKVGVRITNTELVVAYDTEDDFDINILKAWKKAIAIPKKVSEYLDRKFIFLLNGNEVDYNEILIEQSYCKKM